MAEEGNQSDIGSERTDRDGIDRINIQAARPIRVLAWSHVTQTVSVCVFESFLMQHITVSLLPFPLTDLHSPYFSLFLFFTRVRF